MSPIVVEVTNLYKACGSVLAVNRVSFQVEEGEIFGIVSPNVADKTTTSGCLKSPLRPDAGTVRVLGGYPWRAKPAR